MINELSEIKELRKKLGITQYELARRSDVSQSLIAKIESKRIDPTFTNAKKIFNALSEIGKKHEITAAEMMNNKILSVEPDETISEAIKKMKKYNISQMPVIDDHKSIGMISESIILEAILQKRATKVKEIMRDSAPVVSKNSSSAIISNLLKFCPMILVSEDGKLKGVITKSDLLGKLFK